MTEAVKKVTATAKRLIFPADSILTVPPEKLGRLVFLQIRRDAVTALLIFFLGMGFWAGQLLYAYKILLASQKIQVDLSPSWQPQAPTPNYGMGYGMGYSYGIAPSTSSPTPDPPPE